MKTNYFIIIFFTIIYSFPLLAANSGIFCDATCQRLRERQYELEKQRLNDRRERREHYYQRQQLEEKRYQDSVKREHDYRKALLLNEVKKRCDSENMNAVSMNERSICIAVNGYFAFGIPVPDSVLGLTN